MIHIKNGVRLGFIAVALTSTALVVTACSPGTSEPAATTSDAPSDGDSAFFDMLPESIQESGVILAGGLFQTPPVLGAAENDPSQAVGIAPDLAAALEPHLGVEIEFVDTQWPNQIPGLQAGNLDILWGQISDTPERERSAFDFVPFLAGNSGLLLPADNPNDIDSLASMCGFTLALPNGGNQGQIITAVSAEVCEAEGLPAIEQLPLQGGADAYSAVKAGTADAWMDAYSSVRQVAAADSAFTTVEIDIEEIPLEMRDLSGIAIHKDNTGLTEAIYAAMGEIIASGEYDAILAEWGVSDDAISEELFLINPFTGLAPGEMAAS